MTDLKQDYANTCSKLGDLVVTKTVIEQDIQTLTNKLLELLKEIKRVEQRPEDK